MMQKIMSKLSYSKNEEGATMIEYGLIVGLVSVVTIAVLGFVGQDLIALYNAVDVALKSAL
jgi:pilus assembly protein Flp/PilA